MPNQVRDSYSDAQEAIIRSILSVVYPDIRAAAEKDLRDLLADVNAAPRLPLNPPAKTESVGRAADAAPTVPGADQLNDMIRRMDKTAEHLATEELYGFADECRSVRNFLVEQRDVRLAGPGGGNKPATVRFNEDGSLDEIVADGAKVHLEQMSATHWWLGIDDGTRFRHIGLHSKATIKAVMEGEPSHRPPRATPSPIEKEKPCS